MASNVVSLARNTKAAVKSPGRNLPMMNGRFRVVLLAGGPRDRAREIREHLAQDYGIVIKYHWEWDKPNQWGKPIPKDVDFVILLKDMVSHPDFWKVKDICKRQNIQYVLTQRKMATMLAALRAYGIKKNEAAVPLEVTSTLAFFNEPLEKQPQKVEKVVEALATTIKEMPKPLPSAPGPVNIVVAQGALPIPSLPAPKKGMPRPETAAVIAVLQLLLAEDEVEVIISPNGVSWNPLKK